MSDHIARRLASLALTLSMAGAAAQSPALPQPTPGLMPNSAQGKPLFEKHCAACHGADLQGTHQGPPFLHAVYKPSHHGDASFQMAVRYGTRAHHWKFGDMAPVPGVSADEVAHITAYVRQQQREAGIR